MPNFLIANDCGPQYSGQNDVIVGLLQALLDIPQEVAQCVCERLEGNKGWTTTPQELQDIRGIGPKRANKLLAAIELAKQLGKQQVPPGTVIDDPTVAADVLRPYLCFSDVEQFGVISLDIKHRLIAVDVTAIGTATQVDASGREVFIAALRRGACRIIVGHSHPSGDAQPSDADLSATRGFYQSGKMLNIPVLDHIIVCQTCFNSLRTTTYDIWGSCDD